jgi:type II secretory pathway pseudopilin PulG
VSFLASSIHSRRRAFSLVELVIVVGLIVLLAGLALSGLRGARGPAHLTRARAELELLAVALEEFRRQTGDFPQLGGFRQAGSEPAVVGAGPGLETAQAKLFNCLAGVLGPQGIAGAGPCLLDVTRFSLDGTVAAFGARLRASDVALLDPWGRRYFYYYRDARLPERWRAYGYVLYSLGPPRPGSGEPRPPISPTTGLRQPVDPRGGDRNLYASP